MAYNKLFLCRLSVKPHSTSKRNEIPFFNKKMRLDLPKKV